MKLVKFRIQNYKSIKDSGDCYFDDAITILAGKNEAGKTAIMEALEDLNINRSIRENSKPIYDESRIPHITLWIKLEKFDLDNLSDKFQIKFNDNSLLFEYNKKYPNEILYSKSNFTDIFNLDDKLILKDQNFMVLIDTINKIDSNFYIPDEFFNNPFDLLDYLNEYQMHLEISEEDKKNIQEALALMKKLVNSNIEFVNKLNNYVKSVFFPNFILFTTFDDIFPNQVSIANAKNTPLINDLTIISDLDIQKFQSNADPSRREMHKRDINVELSKEYDKFWNQDEATISFSYDSNNFYFWIDEDGILYRPDMRSKGKQWHLAFYIRVTAKSLEGKNNIILIDEPGLFLHAKAQRDILTKLEDCASRRQLVYTTHSPYLIIPDRLNRLRLVIKYEDKGTKIEKLHASADNETLTPIISAIGEDLMSGLRIDRKNNVILEGITDWYIINAFAELLTNKKELYFIPSVGASKEVSIGAILFGWGVDPIFILDNDTAGDDAKKKLVEALSINEDRILRVPFQKRGTIEDLFTNDDFKKFLEKNTDFKGKVIRTKVFFEDVIENRINIKDFSDETIKNFRKLFYKIKDLLKSSFDLKM
ncbi:MAG: ATP-dependent endonuclease [Promethearchaeota archaeon]